MPQSKSLTSSPKFLIKFDFDFLNKTTISVIIFLLFKLPKGLRLLNLGFKKKIL